MPEIVETIIEDDRWAKVGLDALANVACAATLEHLGYDASEFGISLLGCNDVRIANLNAEFRENPKATNILSWPSVNRSPADTGGLADIARHQCHQSPQDLGDMAMAYETCHREANEVGATLAHHVTHLLVHGMLHLLGYDHIRDKDAAIMEGIEAEVLVTLGIEDPYRED